MEALLIGRPHPRGSRWSRRLWIAVPMALALLFLVYTLLLWGSRIEPPPRSISAHRLPVEVRGERSYVGSNWLSRERGLWEYHLAGEPFEMGYAHTRLGQRLLEEADDFMFAEFHRYVPAGWARFLIRLGVRWRYRHLADQIPLDRQQEIAGEAAGYLDRHADFLPTYHRMVFYHALHDITQGVEHSPLLGCSAFAASGAATSNGHLIVGRNFDFEGPEPLDRDKAILFFKPAGRIPFASVAWAGMTGVVTGINAEGIYVSINAARSDDQGGEGIPVELLVREILERAHSIDEAIALVKSHSVMVPDFYLVADGKTGESAVIERTPARIEVRRSRDTILLTNHALAPAFAKDTENDRLRRYLTSGARYQRLSELVRQHRGTIDPRRALEILRDKRAEAGEVLGLGNRNALDALIATHSVVVDATALQLWVSEGPHCLGKYIGFDLRSEFSNDGTFERYHPPSLPEDPIGNSVELRRHRQAVAELEAARGFLARGVADRALEQAQKAVALDDLMPEAHRLLGDLWRSTDRERARREYQRYLELHPPYLHDIEEVKGVLSSL